MEAQQLIKDLGMSPLPEEGGWFKEVYRSKEVIPAKGLPARFAGERSFCTSIYYLLKGDEFSAFHRLRQDEIWHFYFGSSLTLHMIDLEGTYTQAKLGSDLQEGHCFQTTIDHGVLMAATVDRKDDFSLVGCTVAPGFEFQDFEAPDRQQLLDLYPQHKDVIAKLTR